MRKAYLALAGLLALADCGGGGNSGDYSSGTGTAAPATASSTGIWSGTITSSSGSTVPRDLTLIILPSGEARFIEGNCVQMLVSTSVSASFLTGSSGEAYAPDGGVATCPIALTFPNGATTGTASVTGSVVSQSSINGSYSAAGDLGTYKVSYNTAYDRPGTLARIAGTYSNGTLQMSIDSSGYYTGMLGTQPIFGQISTIDVTHNAYRIAMTEGTRNTLTLSAASAAAVTTPASGTTISTATNADGTVSVTTTTSTGPTWSGLGTLLDYSPGTDNYLVLSLANQTSGWTISIIKQ
ncbi:MAG: hypothetical protein ACRYG5_15470 [Janthinobacterium lividum]